MLSSKIKIKSLLIALSVYGFSNAQVSINNTSPQGVFHVDGAKDNPVTGVPTTAQQLNDFVVKADGKVGLGTTTPQMKLDLVTAANAVGLQHTDGTIRLQTFLGRGNTNGNTDAGWLGTSTNHPLDFMTYNNFRMRITPEGNVGIGTSTPAVKLEINNGSTNGAIKIVDGTQGSNKVLMSDANGVGSWRTPASIKPAVTGIYPAVVTTYNSDGTGEKYIGSYIDLTQGRWIINAGLTLYNRYSPGVAGSQRYWLHAYLSTSTTAVQQSGFIHLGPSGSSTGYAGIISSSAAITGASGDDQTLNFMNGSSIIDVTAATIRIYLLMENKPSGYWSYPSGAKENYFYATPIN